MSGIKDLMLHKYPKKSIRYLIELTNTEKSPRFRGGMIGIQAQ